MFGEPDAQSALEAHLVEMAGRAAPGIRSEVGDVTTFTVAKGQMTLNILAAPEGSGRKAQAFADPFPVPERRKDST